MTDWTEWKGGECPIAGAALIEARLLNHEDTIECSARLLEWEHRQMEGDIIAYRTIKES